MSANRYVKLNGNWMDSEWLLVLSAEARLAWVQMLCYVKLSGIGGRVKAKPSMVFARQNFIGEESVEQMIRAAKQNGALVEEDGTWLLTGWSKHQGDETASERQKRWREKQKQVQNGENVTGGNALRNGSNAEERRGEEKKGEDKPPKSPRGTGRNGNRLTGRKSPRLSQSRIGMGVLPGGLWAQTVEAGDLGIDGQEICR
ncbi:hypothetical protein CCB80_03160 [Armatimonadetes bacterium Uphvl-Ar1]|nr:hypothetical protein CCB80_03160 [Armatimonadetes bacterium Uphvl-Ar1]